MSEPYLGDLAKTEIIYNLIQTPAAERDAVWSSSFLAATPVASFRCGEPQLIAGPDGFPYFQLLLPEPGVGFQCYVVEKMIKDFLVTRGYGVVIQGSDSAKPEWVFSAGDILNYYLHQAFYTTESTFSKGRSTETLTKNEQVMIGQPSEQLLPAATRTLLSNFLKANGIASPKILLMTRTTDAGIFQDIAFNITPADFKNEGSFKGVMRAISWYLPRHYSFTGLNESGFIEDFKPL